MTEIYTPTMHERVGGEIKKAAHWPLAVGKVIILIFRFTFENHTRSSREIPALYMCACLDDEKCL